MMDEGNHRARGVLAQLGYTSKGTEQVAVLLEAEHGRITWYGFFTEKTTERTLESLRHLGWEGDDLFDLSGIDKNEVEIVVEHETDEHGEVHARVRWINALVAMRRVMTPADAKVFATKMRGQIVASRKRNGAPAPSAGKHREVRVPKAAQQETSPEDWQDPDKWPPPDDGDAPF